MARRGASVRVTWQLPCPREIHCGNGTDRGARVIRPRRPGRPMVTTDSMAAAAARESLDQEVPPAERPFQTSYCVASLAANEPNPSLGQASVRRGLEPQQPAEMTMRNDEGS
jgi:hypothetical protein